MVAFDSDRYGPTVQRLTSDDRLCDLGPGSPQQAQRDILSQLDVDALFADCEIGDRDMARCCLAALWLRHDFLDESHTISQSVESASGSYWHGIMHRREADYSNAKYWFRRVGEHEIFPELCRAALELARKHSLNRNTQFLFEQTKWQPAAFVDLCQAVAGRRSEAECLAQEIAHAEWQLLFDCCYQRAVQD